MVKKCLGDWQMFPKMLDSFDCVSNEMSGTLCHPFILWSTDKLVWRIAQTIERKLDINWLWSKTCLQMGMVNEKNSNNHHLLINFCKNLMCKCYQHNDITTCYITQFLMMIIYWEYIIRNNYHNFLVFLSIGKLLHYFPRLQKDYFMIGPPPHLQSH